MDFLKRTWAEIDLAAIAGNFRLVRGQVSPRTAVMAVVKADAYGHGDAAAAAALAAVGVDWFGVSNLAEALSLRTAGIRQPVLVLGYTPACHAGELATAQITQTVLDAGYAAALSAAAVAAGVTVECHLKLDTGMGRLGFSADPALAGEMLPAAAAACRRPGLRFTGAFTHFAVADTLTDEADRVTRAQFARFIAFTDALAAAGHPLGMLHCCNSAATCRFPEMHLSMVRPGIWLYGIPPSPEMDGMLPVRPAMVLKTVVSQLKTLPAGAGVSYGLHYTAPGPRRIATVPIGYADGFRRCQGAGGWMLLHGQRAPVVGTICMDQTMLDVTDIPAARPGDEVTVLGGGITAGELAAREGSIPYEVTCLVGKRVPRVYLRGQEG